VFSLRAIAFVLTATLIASPAFASHTHRAPTSGHAHGSHKAAAKSKKARGQQSIDPARVTVIQQALIRQHYLDGEATGTWDAATNAAMQKFQADQGWQTRLMPDARALMKLGLGPDYSNAINAKNSTFAAPAPLAPLPVEQAAGFTTASGIAH
jgi:hypothetical protein